MLGHHSSGGPASSSGSHKTRQAEGRAGRTYRCQPGSGTEGLQERKARKPCSWGQTDTVEGSRGQTDMAPIPGLPWLVERRGLLRHLSSHWSVFSRYTCPACPLPRTAPGTKRVPCDICCTEATGRNCVLSNSGALHRTQSQRLKTLPLGS